MVNVIIAGVQEMESAIQDVAVLLNDVWHNEVVDFGCVSSRIRWIKFKFPSGNVCAEEGFPP